MTERLASTQRGGVTATTAMLAAPAARSPSASALAERFDALFEDELDYVCRSLARLGVHARDVEDVAQEVFIAVHRSLPTADLSRPARPWLFSFAYKTALNYKRLARHRHERADDDRDLRSDATPEQDASAGETRVLVLRALETIPLERRAVLIMCELDGFTAPEVAAELSIPVNTVYSRLRIARGELIIALRALTAGVSP